MQQYLNNQKLKPFQEGQESWDAYFLSGFVKEFQNPYKENTENWKLWNRGWNTNFKGIK